MTDGQIKHVINRELERATTIHPAWPTDPIHAAAIVQEEAGELVKDALQFTYEPEKDKQISDMASEAVQVAAMAIRFLRGLPFYESSPSPQNG